jgi:hypothetical protein
MGYPETMPDVLEQVKGEEVTRRIIFPKAIAGGSGRRIWRTSPYMQMLYNVIITNSQKNSLNRPVMPFL